MMPKNQHCLLVSGLDVVCLYHYGIVSITVEISAHHYHLSSPPYLTTSSTPHYISPSSFPHRTTFHLLHLPSPYIFSSPHFTFLTISTPHHISPPPLCFIFSTGAIAGIVIVFVILILGALAGVFIVSFWYYRTRHVSGREGESNSHVNISLFL